MSTTPTPRKYSTMNVTPSDITALEAARVAYTIKYGRNITKVEAMSLAIQAFAQNLAVQS